MVKSALVKSTSALWRTIRRLFYVTAALVMSLLILSTSSLPLDDSTEKVRAFTRQIEFDYVEWTLSALKLKWFENALGLSRYVSDGARQEAVLDYVELTQTIQQLERDISLFFTDPNIPDPELAAAPLSRRLEALERQRDQDARLVESVLQDQIGYSADQLGLALGGQPVPPVLYHSTKLPLALIVSPRNVIRQDENISLESQLNIEQRSRLEERVDSTLDVSSLVVEIGGVGTYPTMVQQTSDLAWLTEVVAHEWVHNYLTLRPLGMLYTESPEMRVINETTASIAGQEIGLETLKRFYPELVPPPPAPSPPPGQVPVEPPAFDFRKEMNITRVTADQLLAEGKIDEAEEYMDSRRIVFWENGYRGLRKLNQAYFAFHGAYADEPGGAAGAAEDPVGEAVRLLRQQSASLEDFLKRIAWVTSFEQLQEMVSAGPSPYPGG